jgi:hypothetical protein
MDERSTAQALADTLIKRVLTSNKTADLAGELERAYPFVDVPDGRRIWLNAFLRYTWDQIKRRRSWQ